LDPTAMMLLWYDRNCGRLSKRTVREHFPHSAGSPLITFTMSGSSALWYSRSQEEEGESGKAEW